MEEDTQGETIVESVGDVQPSEAKENKLVQKQSNKVGRPTSLTEETLAKLEEIFKLGGKVPSACAYAKINPATYYRAIKESEEIYNRLTTAQNYAIIAARQVVVASILKDRDVNTSKWYIEKHDLQRPTTPQNNTQVNVFTSIKDKYTKAPEPIKAQDTTEIIEDDTVIEVKTNE
jgi:hypothetical protein